MAKPHVLVVAYPAQGHVIPILEFSQWLVKHGVRVTLVNTEFSHKKIAGSGGAAQSGSPDITMVSIPDGLEPSDDRKDIRRNTEAFFRVPPAELEKLISRTIEGEGDKISCVVADVSMAWALDVAARMGIRRAAFCTAPAAMLALFFSIPKLIADGVIDGDGEILKHQLVQLSPTMPAMNAGDFIWACIGDQPTRKTFFHSWADSLPWIQSADRIVCNSSNHLEPGAFSLHPNLLPVGPLLAGTRQGKTAGCFLPEDSGCLAWLDNHTPGSVVYVAHGTSVAHNPAQLEELALGLELSGRPFIWVVRLNGPEEKLPEGFLDRVRDRGLVVGWAPQQEVLSHRAVGCFVSHCGWNSTIEGVACGVPFVCWPYFADQLLNQGYICDEWGVGVGVRKDETGVVGREEIKEKVGRVLGEEGGFKERARELRDKVVGGLKSGGSSGENLEKFVEWIFEDHI